MNISYTKQNFVTGQVLEAEQLNRIEDGIVANETALADKQPKGDYASKDYVVQKAAEVFCSNNQIKAVNHRGYCKEAPENTIPAYILSAKKGFKYVECDVSFTGDNVAVLLHDSTIDRTSDGSGAISSMTYAQAFQYDFGSWFSAEYAGTKIATMKEFLATCKGLGLHPYIELKSNGAYSQSQVSSIVSMVREYGLHGNVTYISFTYSFLEYVKAADETARLGYLVNSIDEDIIANALALQTGKNEVFIDVYYYGATDDAISLCINSKLPIEVWTVNSAELVENMNPYITGVTSDSVNASEVLYQKSLTYVAPPSAMTLSEDWADGSADLTPYLIYGGMINQWPPYTQSAPRKRTTYVGADLTVTPGDIVSVDVADGFRWGIQTLDAAALNSYRNNVRVTTVDSGWLTSDYVIPENAVVAWVTFSRQDNSEFEFEDLGTVTISKK